MPSDTVTRIVRIVDYNSDNLAQLETTSVNQVKQIAKHMGIAPANADEAITEALEDDQLEKIDGRLKTTD